MADVYPPGESGHQYWGVSAWELTFQGGTCVAMHRSASFDDAVRVAQGYLSGERKPSSCPIYPLTCNGGAYGGICDHPAWAK